MWHSSSKKWLGQIIDGQSRCLKKWKGGHDDGQIGLGSPKEVSEDFYLFGGSDAFKARKSDFFMSFLEKQASVVLARAPFFWGKAASEETQRAANWMKR